MSSWILVTSPSFKHRIKDREGYSLCCFKFISKRDIGITDILKYPSMSLNNYFQIPALPTLYLQNFLYVFNISMNYKLYENRVFTL